MHYSIIFHRIRRLRFGAGEGENGDDLSHSSHYLREKRLEFVCNPANNTPLCCLTQYTAQMDLYWLKPEDERGIKVRVWNVNPLATTDEDLPSITTAILNRTTMSKCTFVPHIEWCSQEQPKSGLQIPTTATETPTGTSDILCFFFQQQSVAKSEAIP